MYARVFGPLRGHGAKTEFTLAGGTEGSNPLSSSGESARNPELPGRPEINGGWLGLSLAEIAEMRECGVI
jgi:hypothetical protein